MGKTFESFRIALEGEINCWSDFARVLRKPDREAFDELMDTCCNNAVAMKKGWMYGLYFYSVSGANPSSRFNIAKNPFFQSCMLTHFIYGKNSSKLSLQETKF